MEKKEKRKPTGDYKIGFAAPPEKYRFPKGKCGNPKGRPKKNKELEPEDIENILCATITVQQNGHAIKMPPLEAELQKLVQKALQNKDLKAIERLLKKFKKFNLLPESPIERTGGVITLPDSEEMPYSMCKLLITTFGEPPWSKEEIAAIRPEYKKGEAEYLAMKKETMRSYITSESRGKI